MPRIVADIEAAGAAQHDFVVGDIPIQHQCHGADHDILADSRTADHRRTRVKHDVISDFRKEVVFIAAYRTSLINTKIVAVLGVAQNRSDRCMNWNTSGSSVS